MNRCFVGGCCWWRCRPGVLGASQEHGVEDLVLEDEHGLAALTDVARPATPPIRDSGPDRARRASQWWAVLTDLWMGLRMCRLKWA